MDSNDEQLEQLARDYKHRVGFFARKVARSYVLGERWRDELESAGYWGLAKALKNRRPEASERELSAYVSQRIVGAVIDEARACMTRSVHREVLSAPEVDGGRGEDEMAGGPWYGRLVTDPADSPEEVISAGRALDEIERALGGLRDDQRRWLLQYMEGCSLREIADDEGIALGTLRVRFQKATRTLRGRTPHLRRLLREVEAG
jgi:RNA polymerase sigma factor (sigma-70 family)